jgi:signal transduction histidine kinase
VAVIAPAVALYSLALRRGRRAQLLAAAAAVAAVLISDVMHSGRPGIVQSIGHMLLVAIPLLAAQAIRAHRSNVGLMAQQLEMAEHARQQEAERRAEQERMRIARELHDVVAHTLTEINVQAAAAAERASPGEARDVLERIEQTSHGAIGELRSILGVLRAPTGSEAPRAPTRGVADIDELVVRARTSALDVQLQASGDPPGPMSEAVSLAAYRIVQESLTNARRHAPGAAVQVSLDYNSDRLSLTVHSGTSAGPNGKAHVPGVGIEGMRERALATGGSLEADPTEDGFLVHADLPYQPR